MTSMQKRVVYSTQKVSIFWRFTTPCIMRDAFKASAPWFNFMFFKHSNKEHVFLKENSNNPEDEYVYPISK